MSTITSKVDDKLSLLKLRPSVTSSSSELTLLNLAIELNRTVGVDTMDLFLLRPTDLRSMSSTGLNLNPREDSRSTRFLTQVFSFQKYVAPVCDWISGILNSESARIRIAALATYFPEISSRDSTELTVVQEDGSTQSGTPRKLAIAALANSIRIAVELVKLGHMEQPVVEAVCGTRLDHCGCAGCKDKRLVVFASDTSSSLKRVLDAISEISEYDDLKNEEWSVALELEPGPTYVLNTPERLCEIVTQITKYPKLKTRVGLNVDIAHYRVAGIESDFLDEHKHLIVHSHICDLPGMHTNDQSMGSWTEVETLESPFFPYLLQIATSNHLNRTKCVALELEGNNRTSWLLRGLCELRRLLERVPDYQLEQARINRECPKNC